MTAALHVDPAVGLTAARAGELLSANGPNALPEEKPKPDWRSTGFDAPLFFANATTFRDKVRRLAKADPPPS